MADIKTHLRELSVAMGIKCNNEDINVDKLTPYNFYHKMQTIISNDISPAENILSISSFGTEHKAIISNGIKLGNEIIKNNLVDINDNILWLGMDVHKENPIDLVIGDVGFSLKEDSYILENMGLYKFVNLLTNSRFERGLHIFECFAYEEYIDWFRYTWQILLNSLTKSNWREDNGRYISEIKLIDEQVLLIYNGVVYSRLPISLDIQRYNELTKGLEREKVFAKWIKSQLSQDKDYIDRKNACSITAGANLCNFIKKNLNPVNMARLLQIYDDAYYYAKSTHNQVEIFYVPGKETFSSEIIIKEVNYSVPASQLNILTEIENIKTKNCLVFRNECRFSHGQFNGTPEAKMYYEHGNDLSVIYERIV